MPCMAGRVGTRSCPWGPEPKASRPERGSQLFLARAWRRGGAALAFPHATHPPRTHSHPIPYTCGHTWYGCIAGTSAGRTPTGALCCSICCSRVSGSSCASKMSAPSSSSSSSPDTRQTIRRRAGAFMEGSWRAFEREEVGGRLHVRKLEGVCTSGSWRAVAGQKVEGRLHGRELKGACMGGSWRALAWD
eukprot:359251-Chlamydomonas_euryale.AAC.2